MALLKSDLEAVNKLIGGWPSGIPVNLFGAFMSGKTLLTLQEAYYIVSQRGGEITILDGDGGADVFWNQWKDVFTLKYGVEPKVNIIPSGNEMMFLGASQKVPYMKMRIFEAFGVNARVKMGEKCEFEAVGISKPQIPDNTTVLVIDSFSQPMKDCFHGVQSFGGRAGAENMLFGLIKSWLFDHPDSFCFVNCHQSANPLTGEVTIAGGSPVIQNSKVSLYLDKIKGKSYAKLWVFRYPNVEPWSKYEWLRYSDLGVSDSQPPQK